MGEKLEGFDPTKHRILEDEKSWVNKEIPKWDFEPMEVKHQYNEFVDRVVAANPDLSPQQTYKPLPWQPTHPAMSVPPQFLLCESFPSY